MSSKLIDFLVTFSGGIVTVLTALFLLLKSSKLVKKSIIKSLFTAVDEEVISNSPFFKSENTNITHLSSKIIELEVEVKKISTSNLTQDAYLNEIKNNISTLNNISYRLENASMRSELINQLYYVISKKGKVPTEFWIHLCDKYDEYVKRGLNSNVSVLFKEASKYIVTNPT